MNMTTLNLRGCQVVKYFLFSKTPKFGAPRLILHESGSSYILLQTARYPSRIYASRWSFTSETTTFAMRRFKFMSEWVSHPFLAPLAPWNLAANICSACDSASSAMGHKLGCSESRHAAGSAIHVLLLLSQYLRDCARSWAKFDASKRRRRVNHPL